MAIENEQGIFSPKTKLSRSLYSEGSNTGVRDGEEYTIPTYYYEAVTPDHITYLVAQNRLAPAVVLVKSVKSS